MFLFFYSPDVVSAALVPVKPFPEPPENSPTLEIEEFVPQEGQFASPFAVYKNHLYVYPKNLKYDSQKVFAKVGSSQRFSISIRYVFL